MDSTKKLEKPKTKDIRLKNLSKNIAEHLIGCMEKMNDEDLTPVRVNAICNCASQLHKVMRLNVDMYRMGIIKEDE